MSNKISLCLYAAVILFSIERLYSQHPNTALTRSTSSYFSKHKEDKLCKEVVIDTDIELKVFLGSSTVRFKAFYGLWNNSYEFDIKQFKKEYDQICKNFEEKKRMKSLAEQDSKHF